MRLLPHACYRGCVVHLGGADESSFFGKGTSDEPRANGHGVRRPEEEPGLQERLGGWPFRADAIVPRELEPGGMGLSPGEAVLLSGAPRGAADPRDAGARGLRLIEGCGSPLGAIHRGAWKRCSALRANGVLGSWPIKRSRKFDYRWRKHPCKPPGRN